MTNGSFDPISDIRRELMLTEYKTMHDETLKRMDHRITLITSPLAVNGAILGIGVERQSATLLLITPTISALFGLLVLYHTKMIADIARYILNYIELPLATRYEGSLGWYTRPTWRHK